MALSPESPRFKREFLTLQKMVGIYCKAHHLQPFPCQECQGLLDYAQHRLTLCRHGKQKPACAQCPHHCYKKGMREQIQKVMRFSGPRMVLHHPVLSFYHLWDKKCKATKRSSSRNTKNTSPITRRDK